MIKFIAHLLILFFISAGVSFFTIGITPLVISAVVTTSLLIINFIGLFLFWKLVIYKKSIALGVLIIILKYPLLGFAVHKLSKADWFNSFGLIFGFLYFVIVIVLLSLFRNRFGYFKN